MKRATGDDASQGHSAKDAAGDEPSRALFKATAERTLTWRNFRGYAIAILLVVLAVAARIVNYFGEQTP